MTFLNAQQLAFILEIKKQEARSKIIFAHCADKGIKCTAYLTEDKKLFEPDEYPESVAIAVIAQQCNLPDLQKVVDDIRNNYLSRTASKKWILCDYPEKQISKMKEKGEKNKIKLPPALKSLLPISTVQNILTEWERRFPHYNGIQSPIEE